MLRFALWPFSGSASTLSGLCKHFSGKVQALLFFRLLRYEFRPSPYGHCLQVQRCDSSKGNTFRWRKWDRLFQMADV